MLPSTTLKYRLQTWALRNHVRPADFHKATGFCYQHAYNLLRGKASVTPEALGRILLAYGAPLADWLVQPEESEPPKANASANSVISMVDTIGSQPNQAQGGAQ